MDQRTSRRHAPRVWGIAGAILCAAAAAGCTAEVRPRPVYVTGGVATTDVEYVDAPVDVYTSPQVYYEGSTHYYVNGSWYRPSERGWVRYRQPPAGLTRVRPYVQQAPPAARYRTYTPSQVQVAPPAREQGAVRVR